MIVSLRTPSAACLVAFVAFALIVPVASASAPGGAAPPAAGATLTAPTVRFRDAAADEAPWRSAGRANLLSSVAADRVAAGLVAYRRDPALDDIAQARADHLAASGSFGHLAAGAPILDPVMAAGVRPYLVGEAMGWSSDASTDATIARIRALWLASPSHRAVVLADWASYAGVGLATDGTRTLVVLVVADTPDRTAPSVSVIAATRVGTTITVRWTADDPRLQARTAGIGSVIVDYSVDGAPWRAACTGATGITTIAHVPAGRAVDIRVRARDRAGNVSPWATARVAPLP